MGVAIVISMNFPLTTIPRNIWGLIILSGIIHAAYVLALSSAYEKGEISYVYPIVRSAPAFVPLVAFIVLGETVSLKGGMGILIVVSCVLVLLLQGKMEKGSSIIEVLFRKENFWAFVTLGTVVCYSILDKAGMSALYKVTELPARTQSVIYFLLEITVCYSIYWIYMLRNQKAIQWSVCKHEWFKIIFAAFGTMASYVLILHVMKTEKLSYIITLRQSSVLFAVIVGWFYFREPHFRVRLLISLCMILGFYLVAIG
jgi:drug/metabolite transporter (DMT)-like permease